MKTKKIERYECEVCGTVYDKKESALQCESRLVSQDKGVKVGDLVLITGGEGAGFKLQVKKIGVLDKDWGHYAWEKYWHTVYLTGDVVGGWGSRLLTFDSYDVIP